jgi:hypothetical protein
MKFEPKTKLAVCTICGAAMFGAFCYHTWQLKASNIEITSFVAQTSSDTGMAYDLTVYEPTLEQHHRADMPKIPGVVFKATLRST